MSEANDGISTGAGAASVPAAPSIKLPSRAVLDAIIRRFLKEGQNIYWAREMPVMYRLYKAYPSLVFWQAYELPFGQNTLNMMGWFERGEGKVELERAWLLFNYNPPSLAAPPPSPPLDAAPKVADTEGESEPSLPPPIAGPRRARTVAELMKGV